MRLFLFLFFIIYCYSSCQNLNVQTSDKSNQKQDTISKFKLKKSEALVGLSSDSIIYLDNSSFEDGKYGHSTLPKNWLHCDNENSPSDLHHSNSNYFSISKAAKDGNQFVGMIARRNHSFETIAQKLPLALKKGMTYKMDFSLAKAKDFISVPRATGKEENFNTPIVLQIWGGYNYCKNGQLLYESIAITHLEWKKYTATFTVKDNYEFIIFNAFHSNSYDPPYDGNLLIDHLSPIYKIEK